jgi:hypothetical protein
VTRLLFEYGWTFDLQHTFSSKSIMKHAYPLGYTVTLSKNAYGNNGDHLPLDVPKGFAVGLIKLNQVLISLLDNGDAVLYTHYLLNIRWFR